MGLAPSWMARHLLTFVLAGVALAAICAPASANRGQLSIFQDDRVTRQSGDEARTKALNEMDRLGADVVKVIVNWRTVAPAGKSKPSGFDGANPADYPAAAWAPYDAIVRGANARNMGVLFALGGWAPDWASAGTPSNPGSWKPNVKEYGKFAQAIGRRYSGNYAVTSSDEMSVPLPLPLQATPSQAGARLPRVRLWSAWNEPNIAAWLAPQHKKGRPVAPHHYRKMVRAANAGLNRSGHRRSTFLIGELAPYGASEHRMRPLEFLREMACVDKRFKAFRGKAARKRGCRNFRALPGDGFAFHPYTLAGGPNVAMSHPDEVTIGYLPRLVKTLNRLGRKNRLQRRRMDVWVTEFGFQTAPPDTFQTPIGKVPGFMGQSEWLSWKNGRVASHAQYLLYDAEDNASFQTGIRFAGGKAKPGVYNAYRLPFYVRKKGKRRVQAWGGIRAAGKGRRVTVQSRRKGKWKKVGTARTTRRGYFRKTFRVAAAGKRTYRFKAGGRTSVKLRARG